METKWIKFNALGSEVIVLASLEVGQEYLLEQAKRTIEDFEKNFSRFIKDNELDKFNSAEGSFLGSNLFVDILKEAQRLHHLTEGVFDPTVITSLEGIGYNKSFTDIEAKGATLVHAQSISDNFSKRARIDLVQITGNEIMKPSGLRIDLGGIGKGFLADHLSEQVFKHVNNFWISLGGDLILNGHEKPLEQKGWKVGVQDPHDLNKEAFFIKTGGQRVGIATSGVFKRKGVSGDFQWHHIIDPRTGLPTANDILATTVIAANARRADVLAKTVIILGREKGLELIDKEPDAAAIIFFKEGGVAFSARAPQYL